MVPLALFLLHNFYLDSRFLWQQANGERPLEGWVESDEPWYLKCFALPSTKKQVEALREEAGQLGQSA